MSTNESSEFSAFKPNDPDAVLDAIIRLPGVSRWHTVGVVRTQNLAEHSAVVALLTYHIAHTTPGMFFGPAESVVYTALIHDLPEVYTGDIPPHAKRHLQGLDALERQATPPSLMVPSSPEVRTLIKLVDLFEALRYVRIYHPQGSAHAEWVRHTLLDAVEHVVKSLENRWPIEIISHVLGVLQKYYSL